MKKLLLIATIAILAIACDKNQSAVKKLNGTWKATSYTITNSTGTALDLTQFGQMEYTFDGCKLKNNEYCNATVTTIFLGQLQNQINLYTVKNDGKTLEIVATDSSATVSTLEIIDLSKSKLVLKQTDGTTISNLELEKL